MAKQTSTPTIEKDGFVLYRDMVSIANEALPDYHDKGKLFALITQFVNQQPLEDAPERVEMAFKFLKNGIEKNSAKYARKKAAMQAYYEERNKEKSEKSEKEDKSAKSQRAAKKTTNNSISTSNSTSDSYSNSDSNSNSNSHSKQGIINDTIKENINNNSLSENKPIYTPEEVEAILREREIFFKPSEFKKYYLLNEAQYHWKYDPYVAALTYIERHPNSLKKAAKGGVENAPQYAAPPNLADVRTEIDADMRTKAERLWKDTIVKKFTEAVMPSREDVKTAFNLLPLSLEMRGYSNYTLLLGLRDTNNNRITEDDDVEKFDRMRTLIREHMDIFKACRITDVKLV